MYWEKSKSYSSIKTIHPYKNKAVLFGLLYQCLDKYILDPSIYKAVTVESSCYPTVLVFLNSWMG